ALGLVSVRHLQDEVAARLVHPVEHDDMRAGLDAVEGRGPARVDLDGADRIGLARVLRAILAPGPRRADPPDEIERGVEGLGQLDGGFALADSVRVRARIGLAHIGLLMAAAVRSGSSLYTYPSPARVARPHRKGEGRGRRPLANLPLAALANGLLKA